MTNNDVTKIVFISTRWINECLVLGKEDYDNHLVFSESMKEFFLDIDDTKKRLQEIAKSWQETSGLTVRDAKTNIVSFINNSNDYRELTFINPDKPRKGERKIVDWIQEVGDDDINSFSKLMVDLKFEFGQQYPQLNSILDQSIPRDTRSDYNYNTPNILNSQLISDGQDYSHMDKPKGEKQVKHRLGIYTLVDKPYALCAIWPWIGDKKEDHDHRWLAAICNSIIELYPNAREVLLLLHDGDFIEYDHKNRPIGRFNYTSGSQSFDYHLVVFQHSNIMIDGIVKNENGTVEDIYTKIDKYATGFDEMQKADENNKTEKAYNNALQQIITPTS